MTMRKVRSLVAEVRGTFGAALCVLMLTAAVVGAQESAPPAIVRAKARSLDGRPVAGVQVTVELRTGPGESRTWSGATDARGEVELALEVAAFQASLRVEAPPESALAPAAVEPPGMLSLAAGEAQEAVILMVPATARLHGTVTSGDGTAVEGAEIRLTRGSFQGAFLDLGRTTGPDGRYEFEALAPGSYTVRSVGAPAGAPWIKLHTWRPHGMGTVELGRDEQGRKDFRLPRGARMLGRVLDAQGRPVEGATVSCGLDAASENGPPSVYQVPGQCYGASATSDAGGSYILAALTQETYLIRVEPPEGTPFAPAAVRGIAAAEQADVAVQDITLYEGGAMLCHVVGADGRPIAGAGVQMTIPAPGRFRARGVERTTDEQGAFTVAGLATGRYDVHVRPAAGDRHGPKAFEGLPAVAGLTSGHRLELPIGAQVGGVVSSPDGRPVPGAVVMARYGYTSHGRAVADAEGRYALVGLPATPDKTRHVPRHGPVNRLYAAPPAERPLLRSAEAGLPDLTLGGAGAVDVTLALAVCIAGRVTDPDGQPVAGCTVAVHERTRGAIRGYGSTRADAEGHYRLGHLPAGQLYLVVSPPGERALAALATDQRRFTAGEETIVNVAMQKGAVLSGRVVDEAGRPVPGARVQATPKGGSPTRTFVRTPRANTDLTGPDGAFRIDCLEGGAYAVACTPWDPALRAATKDIQAMPGGEQRLEIVVRQTGSIQGVVKDSTGRALSRNLAGLRLHRRDEPSERQRVTGYPDDRGQFRFAGLLPGLYRIVVNVTRAGQQEGLTVPAPVDVTVEGGAETNQDIEVPKQQAPGR